MYFDSRALGLKWLWSETMSNKSIKITAQPQTPDPRRAYETAMAQLQHGKERSRSQMPICIRPRKEQPPVTEKQIVTDAAHALALLWKVAPSMVR
jgi:hypothetical protein